MERTLVIADAVGKVAAGNDTLTVSYNYDEDEYYVTLERHEQMLRMGVIEYRLDPEADWYFADATDVIALGDCLGLDLCMGQGEREAIVLRALVAVYAVLLRRKLVN